MNLIVADSKQFACDEGLPQIVGYMQAAFNAGGGVPVFGICSNVQKYKFLKYDPSDKSEGSVQGFKLYRDFTLLFPQMFEQGFKQVWLDEHTEFLRILYSIIYEQLELD